MTKDCPPDKTKNKNFIKTMLEKGLLPIIVTLLTMLAVYLINHYFVYTNFRGTWYAVNCPRDDRPTKYILEIKQRGKDISGNYYITDEYKGKVFKGVIRANLNSSIAHGVYYGFAKATSFGDVTISMDQGGKSWKGVFFSRNYLEDNKPANIPWLAKSDKKDHDDLLHECKNLK